MTVWSVPFSCCFVFVGMPSMQAACRSLTGADTRLPTMKAMGFRRRADAARASLASRLSS
jgi:hypothetical protein